MVEEAGFFDRFRKNPQRYSEEVNKAVEQLKIIISKCKIKFIKIIEY